MTWLAFGLVTLVIVYAGSNLSRYGDLLAERTGLGRTWIGVILVASTTSLPELITGFTSTAIARLPDIAVGDVLGSCMFNLLILALLDVVGGRTPLSARAQQGHVLTLGFGSLLMGLVGFAFLIGPITPTLAWVGVTSLVLVAVYLLAMRVVFVYERTRLAADIEAVAEERAPPGLSLRQVWLRYTVNAVVVVAAAIWLPYLGETIARETGLGQTFVGNSLIALSTSLPELVTSVAAVRLGATDLAFGNLFGSNLFNILILALDDVFYTPGPLLAAAQPAHLISVMAVVSMYAIVAIGLAYQARAKLTVMTWDSWGVVVVYLLSIGLLYVSH